MQYLNLGPRDVPSPLEPFYDHLKRTFPTCVVRFICKDFDRQNSVGILNPTNNRSINIMLDQSDIRNGRCLLDQQEIDEIANQLLL